MPHFHLENNMSGRLISLALVLGAGIDIVGILSRPCSEPIVRPLVRNTTSVYRKSSGEPCTRMRVDEDFDNGVDSDASFDHRGSNGTDAYRKRLNF